MCTQTCPARADDSVTPMRLGHIWYMGSDGKDPAPPGHALLLLPVSGKRRRQTMFCWGYQGACGFIPDADALSPGLQRTPDSCPEIQKEHWDYGNRLIVLWPYMFMRETHVLADGAISGSIWGLGSFCGSQRCVNLPAVPSGLGHEAGEAMRGRGVSLRGHSFWPGWRAPSP